LCVLEAVVRLRPSALGNDESTAEESFRDGLLEYPHYTKPAELRGLFVPEVLRSGDHERIARWRRAQSLARTIQRRPDLIQRRGGLSEQDRALLEEFATLDGPPPSG
jgi:tRNA (guanine37-N1)-methyltransferase